MKKMLRLLFRLTLAAGLAMVVVALFQPDLIPHPAVKSWVLQLRTDETKAQANKQVDQVKQSASNIMQASSSLSLPQTINLDQMVQTYTQEHLEQVKVRICEEILGQTVVVPEATTAAKTEE